MQEYERFIHDVCSFIQENLGEDPEMFFNIYFDEGRYWIKLEPTNYVTIHTANSSSETIDPMCSFSGHELRLEVRRKRTPEEISQALKEFVRIEIPKESFEMWKELT